MMHVLKLWKEEKREKQRERERYCKFLFPYFLYSLNLFRRYWSLLFPKEFKPQFIHRERGREREREREREGKRERETLGEIIETSSEVK